MKHLPRTSGAVRSAYLPPMYLQQFLVWSRLGIQSFGGGMATLSLIRRAVVDEQGWISADDFTLYWALVLMVPGVNLLGLTVLIGQQVGRARGVVIALVGLLFPSVSITILLTALYSQVAHIKSVEAAVRGIIPATVGIGIYTGCQIAWPLLQRCKNKGTRSLLIALSLLVGSALIASVGQWPVVVILIIAGGIGAATGFAGKPVTGEQN